MTVFDFFMILIILTSLFIAIVCSVFWYLQNKELNKIKTYLELKGRKITPLQIKMGWRFNRAKYDLKKNEKESNDFSNKKI